MGRTVSSHLIRRRRPATAREFDALVVLCFNMAVDRGEGKAAPLTKIGDILRRRLSLDGDRRVVDLDIPVGWGVILTGSDRTRFVTAQEEEVLATI